MRWTVFSLAAYVVLVLQVGLGKQLAISTARGSIQPEFVLLLAVFLALSAPLRVAVAAGGILGLLIDVVSSPYGINPAHPPRDGAMAVTILGPYALGYLAGVYLVVQMRPMLFRHHPLTIAAMTLVAGLAVHLVVLGLFSIRRWYEPIDDFSAKAELAVRIASLVYTGGIGVLLAYPLNWSSPAFAFHGHGAVHHRGRGGSRASG